MNRAALLLGLLSASLMACEKPASDTVVVVTVSADPTVPAVTQLQVSVSNAGDSDKKMFPPTNLGRPIDFTNARFALTLPHRRSGSLTIAILGLDADSIPVAAGTSDATIVVGGASYANVNLSPLASADGGIAEAGRDPGDTGGRGVEDASGNDAPLNLDTAGAGGASGAGGAGAEGDASRLDAAIHTDTSGSGGSGGRGTVVGSGGSSALGGATGTGGTSGTGGTAAGGTTSIGGASGPGRDGGGPDVSTEGTGGVTSMGGVTSTGGAASSGGSTGTGGVTSTGGGSGQGGSCIGQVVSNGYACGAVPPCRACSDNLVSREAGCQKGLDCLAAAWPCTGNCLQNCLNLSGDLVAQRCVVALQTAACSGTGCGGANPASP